MRASNLPETAVEFVPKPLSAIPSDPEALLVREIAAQALTASGYPTTASTLATLASRGGGPEFHRYGPRPLYRWRTTLAWAQSRLSPPMRSTSEIAKPSVRLRRASDPGLDVT
jgi:hypothetical protein